VTDLLAQATTELYEADPDEFTRLRAELVTNARDHDQPAVAKQIGALRKPTRSAWVVNRLSREHPEAATRLAELAEQLKAGGDGARIRELTQARSRLVDDLTRQALAAAGQQSPPAALREDVLGTLSAALADPEVAAGLAAGTLTKAAHWAGFGMVPLSDAAPAKPRTLAAPPPAADELSRRRQEKSDLAKRDVAQLTEAAESASKQERELEETVRRLEADLEQARLGLAEARRQAYRTESRRRRAVEELKRLQE
jgi:septal ring factor EnvC (AmiA/AmiB activator)